MTNFFSITLTLFFVIDALGNIPVFLHLLKHYEKKRRRIIAVRELLLALGIMILFNYLGRILLSFLEIQSSTVQLAGGIVLFLISIRLIFAHEEEEGFKWKSQDPFIVPIATPIIAGPSVLSVIMIFSQEEPNHGVLIGAICLAWLLSSILFLLSNPIFNLFKEKGLDACQRLMGLIVALISVQLFIKGITGVFK